MMKRFVLMISILVVGIGGVHASEPVSIESLLHEMIDRDAAARFPQPDFRLKQHSSYNRASETPNDPKGWFANHDFNKGANDRNFIRVEENHGQKEWVLMEDNGPGAIVRIWQPFKGPPKNALIRFYLDGAEEPALAGNPCTLFNGKGLVPYPFAHPSLLSAVSFFPIPYAKSCKVTMTQLPRFFQITFRKYDDGTPVKTFTLADFDVAASSVKQTGKDLLNPKATGADNPLGFTAAGQVVDLYAARPTPSGPIELGAFEPVDGAYVLRVEVVGKNPNSKGTLFGLDCVTLSAAGETE